MDCLLSLADRAVTYFNRMAFVYVSIYGLDFMSSGVAVTEMVRSKGVTAMVNDSLVENVFDLTCVVMALLCSMVAYIYSVGTSSSKSLHALLSLSGALIGYVMAIVVTSVIESSVSTITICFIEDPQALAESHPELSSELTQAWEMMHHTPIMGTLASGGSKTGSHRGSSTTTFTGSYEGPEEMVKGAEE